MDIKINVSMNTVRKKKIKRLRIRCKTYIRQNSQIPQEDNQEIVNIEWLSWRTQEIK